MGFVLGVLWLIGIDHPSRDDLAHLVGDSRIYGWGVVSTLVSGVFGVWGELATPSVGTPQSCPSGPADSGSLHEPPGVDLPRLCPRGGVVPTFVCGVIGVCVGGGGVMVPVGRCLPPEPGDAALRRQMDDSFPRWESRPTA